MKAQARTREVSDFTPFGDLASFGAACLGLDVTLEHGYAYSTRPSHGAHFVSGAVALLRSHTGCFGWRLTGRQAGALAQAGFPCGSWA